MANKKDELISWYDKVPTEFKKKYHNPQFKKHFLNIPLRMAIIGGSGSGKSTLVLEIIHRMKQTFGLIVLCCKSADEPLYQLLRSKLDDDQLHIYENGEVPPLETYHDSEDQILMIFDDLVNEKDQSPIIEWFIRGRKIAGGVSMIYLSQSYFKTAKTIRVNCNYILLKRLSSMRDLTNILSDFNLGIDKKVLLSIYKKATENQKDFLMIDVDAPPEKRFRHNFLRTL